MSEKDKKFAYLPANKQQVKYFDPPTARPYIEGFTSVSETTKQTFTEKLSAYAKKNPFVIGGIIKHIILKGLEPNVYRILK